ncbi:MAG: transcription antitermination factor NusB [Candidatus Lindowbacteria bacterium RIFCSPLOWO2_12_FULL_62_27]|nr:MAG: transcription antitermination factor NusB [Candidatus Lindowbacteria bacterium RIFCSPLOWO2_12_FULL_62_27]OGH56698.1 MAG: transcription antitermination factor NusB [Candidatus Lindowbacteria bacterium RIFCSPLOWO2_02_FULL_62_12]
MKGGEAGAAAELETLLQNEPADKEIESYARKLLETLSSTESTDSAIQSVLSSWTLERVTPVERCILRVGLTELEGNLGVPPIVAIDEAIRLSKEFGTKNSEKFVNGVLDAIYKKKKPAS